MKVATKDSALWCGTELAIDRQAASLHIQSMFGNQKR